MTSQYFTHTCDGKSRWIIRRLDDPDIAALSLTVPTLSTSGAPLALHCLSSVKAKALVGDVKSAFTQGLRNQREEFLFAPPPAGGIPGEDPNELIFIELPTEVYCLETGPPGWRRSLLTACKEYGFKRHPLAPRAMPMHETLNGQTEQFS